MIGDWANADAIAHGVFAVVIEVVTLQDGATKNNKLAFGTAVVDFRDEQHKGAATCHEWRLVGRLDRDLSNRRVIDFCLCQESIQPFADPLFAV